MYSQHIWSTMIFVVHGSIYQRFNFVFRHVLCKWRIYSCVFDYSSIYRRLVRTLRSLYVIWAVFSHSGFVSTFKLAIPVHYIVVLENIFSSRTHEAKYMVYLMNNGTIMKGQWPGKMLKAKFSDFVQFHSGLCSKQHCLPLNHHRIFQT